MHELGQQLSPFAHAVIAGYMQVALHVVELPISTFCVHALLSLQLVGQVDFGSQVSPASTTPLPHDGLQSASVTLVQPFGQQPSPAVHIVIDEVEHAALQFALLPVRRSVVHVLPSLHVVGHVPGGSHVSFMSMLPSPQEAEQSLSLALLQLAGQQPSPSLHALIGSRVHTRSHVSAAPDCESTVHALKSSHGAQSPSQVSPSSTTPLPHKPLGSIPASSFCGEDDLHATRISTPMMRPRMSPSCRKPWSWGCGKRSPP